MKRCLIALFVFFALSPTSNWAQTQKLTKILIFPFKIEAQGTAENVGGDLAGVLGSELTRDGDVEIISGRPFASAVEGKKVDPARVERILQRAEAETAIWGALTKLDDGLGLEVYALQKDKGRKPRFFSVTGKDMEEVVGRIKDVAMQISGATTDSLKIGDIKIDGNKRIQKEAILNKLNVKPGAPFRKNVISDEIREIYSMGYFDDVQIKADETPKGEIDLSIMLKERPSIKEIEIEGNKLFTKDNILDAITTKSFNVASNEKIHSDIATLKKKYEKEGYFQPEIIYELKEISPSEAKLIFRINEGSKSYLTDLQFEGAHKLTDKELKRVMNVKEKTWTWFLDDSGQFTRDKLEENRMRLMLFYMDNGFINVQVGAPDIAMKEGKATVTYPIREGDRFQVRNVDVEGDLVLPADKLRAGLEVKPHTWFKRSQVGDDIKAITKLYNNLGYAYADVEPRQQINEQHNFVDVKYHINKGDRVTIERVDIAGNDRTRDKVIRRSVDVAEGDLYSADKFDATKSKLEGTEFFENVRLKTAPGSRPDLMNVMVEVQEKKTGSLSAGLGYSSQDGAMGNINLKERNLLGLGIVANLKANLSGRKNSYEGSITYPWLFDMPLSSTLRGYRTTGREQNFSRESEGFGVTVGFPLYGLWSMTTTIGRDSSKLTGFERTFARSIVNYYKAYNTTPERFTNFAENSLGVTFSRDTRDTAMIPTFGSRIALGSRWTGFGGDVAFSNYYSEAVHYHRLFWKAILKMKANTSILQGFANDPIPFDRRISLGGISSIRGYKQGEIGPRDIYGNIMGGDRSAYANIETFFPIVESLKVSGVVFFDVGSAWNASNSPEIGDVKAGYGLGVRWMSPMGPIRFEYGWKVAPAPGEERGAAAFGMGQLF